MMLKLSRTSGMSRIATPEAEGHVSATGVKGCKHDADNYWREEVASRGPKLSWGWEGEGSPYTRGGRYVS